MIPLRAYITVCFGHDGLMPWFVRHYARLGVDEFYLMTYGTDEQASQAESKLAELCAEHDVRGIRGEAFPAEVFAHRHRQRRVREAHQRDYDNDAWAVHADLDEFAELPPGIASLKDLFELTDSHMVCGIWLDRIAANGQMKALPEPDQMLEHTYPMAGRIRRRMRMNEDVVVAARFGPLSHHPRKSSWWRQSLKLNVHHFKWQANVTERMAIRTKSAFVKGAHLRRVHRVHDLTLEGIPRRWFNRLGVKLGI